MNTIRKLFPILLAGLLFCACKKNSDTQQSTTNNQPTTTELKPSPFNAENAFSYIQKQISFGPRVPNTPEHKACAQWIISTLEQFGAKVTVQCAETVNHKGQKVPLTNIIASYNPENTDRILLLAHWDTRPVADNDPTPALQNKPILGADDGGSGVAVLLELARLLQSEESKLGVDLFFCDAEDSGESNSEESWCLGSTYWSKNPHTPNYKAKYGILLDMVGAKEARFYWEYFSKANAPTILANVWSNAAELGFAKYFIQADGAALTDDHIPIIKNSGIPTIDIVNYDPQRQQGFGTHWHTHADNIDIIDKDVLKAVGATIWATINQ